MSNENNFPDALDELDKLIPVLDEEIPELSHQEFIDPEISIPELNEQLEINEHYSVSLDSDNTTETIEQQLIRTRHEEPPSAPVLIDNSSEADAELIHERIPVLTESYIEEPATTEENSGASLKLVTNAQEELSINYIESLDKQQQSLEQEALQLKANEDEEPVANDENQSPEALLEDAWITVENLLMQNLPPQLAGAFLLLLNSRFDENKQELIEELDLLDKESLLELQEALKKI